MFLLGVVKVGGQGPAPHPQHARTLPLVQGVAVRTRRSFWRLLPPPRRERGRGASSRARSGPHPSSQPVSINQACCPRVNLPQSFAGFPCPKRLQHRRQAEHPDSLLTRAPAPRAQTREAARPLNRNLSNAGLPITPSIPNGYPHRFRA